MICRKSDNDSIEICSDILNKNGVVIIPTDTVYGFSALADCKLNTDKKIFKIKGRDENKPFIQLISSPSEIFKYTDDVIPEKLLALWPGPLTIIVHDKRFPGKTTAFRCPGDLWLRKVLERCSVPLYSSSVNRSGQPVIAVEQELIDEFSSEVDLIVVDGDKKNAKPSTIVMLDGDEIKIIRQGEVELKL